jgi:hypothetical protein
VALSVPISLNQRRFCGPEIFAGTEIITVIYWEGEYPVISSLSFLCRKYKYGRFNTNHCNILDLRYFHPTPNITTFDNHK